MKIQSIAPWSVGALLTVVALAASAQVAKRSPYIVQLVDAPVAAYEGTVSGLAATRPSPGQRLDMASARVKAYSAYLDGKVTLATAKVPAAPVYQRYGVVVNGFAAMLTPDELNKLRVDPSVKAITADVGMPLDTSYTTSQFLKLAADNGAWSRLDANGKAIKGEGVIIAMVDTGVWPENVSVSDKVGANGKPVPSHEAGTVVYDPLPAGRYRGTCQVGEGFTAAMCNNKLVGAQVFNATFRQQQAGKIWPGEYNSPRDEDGHGTHTLTTAGGNANSPVNILGSPFEITGVAPRARLAAYKACSSFINASGARQNTCYQGDTVAAINKAVADGVDVINFSISGDSTSVTGIVAQAMLGAAKANVFVSASAGNSGPSAVSPAYVAHVSPWVATVGNSSHDRYTEATVTLGSNGTVSGASFQTSGLPQAGLVWARNVGFGDAAGPGSNQALCFGAADSVAPLLDPAKVSGKILVCDRGGNVLVNKVANAKAAGAVGVIILNRPAEGAVAASANTTPIISAVLPTVHVPNSGFAKVTAEAGLATGTGAFAASAQVAGVIAPVMNTSSSRGPNQGDSNLMKPDITAPGTDIIAGYTAPDVTLAERAAIVAGTAVGRQGADLLTGTSMSSPHVAGAAALMRQANPTWSVAAIKSALMTSALQNLKTAAGANDVGVGNPSQLTVNAGPFGWGSGHLSPNDALNVGAVFDITNAQFDAYSAGSQRNGTLNLPSITLSNVLGVSTVTRTIKNTGTSPLALTATPSLNGFNVSVSPSSFTIPAGGSQSFTVTVSRTTAAFNNYAYGSIVFAGGGQSLRSPLIARPAAIVAYSSVSDTRVAGTRIFTIGTGFAGATTTASSGMVPATQTTGRVEENQQVCSPIVVPSGTWAIRVQLFNSETEGGAASDLDVALYNGAGTLVGASFTGTSDELVSLTNPSAGTYTVCVEGFDPVGTSASFTLNTWVVKAPVGAQTLRAAGPSQAVLGGIASVAASWTAQTGKRSLGVVRLSQTGSPTVLSSTAVFVDNVTPAPELAAAPVLRQKTALK